MTFEFIDRLRNIVVQIRLSSCIVEFLCKLGIVHESLPFGIEVVHQILYLPILEDCHLL